jgi:hypothetical protein
MNTPKYQAMLDEFSDYAAILAEIDACDDIQTLLAIAKNHESETKCAQIRLRAEREAKRIMRAERKRLRQGGGA